MPVPLLVFVTDLIFSTRIATTARALEIPFQIIRSVEALKNAHPPTLLIVDLNAAGDPLEAIDAAGQLSPPPTIVAFLSHVQVDLAEEAQRRGATLVMPRSTFTQRLEEILKLALAAPA